MGLCNVAVAHEGLRLLPVQGHGGAFHKGGVLFLHARRGDCHGHAAHAVIEDVDHLDVGGDIMVYLQPAQQVGHGLHGQLAALLPAVPIGVGQCQMLDVLPQHIAAQIRHDDFRHGVSGHHQDFQCIPGGVLGDDEDAVRLSSHGGNRSTLHGPLSVHAHAEDSLHMGVAAIGLPVIFQGSTLGQHVSLRLGVDPLRYLRFRLRSL